ncbi:hypothetical protein SARC_01669 [Sphaeroforma arctica JP610]|uniref:SH2 domain-containing protein n=1 Tax=Sphaeroforma arctica JP610 TaxID=667725 RepID=A0A0L0GAZ7_9EUKA|nr:hypothetical protein SARC_01669 [Sphaeroforma arctica JP610]KNC86192.1 hypothetical protein SARC_01669 [Sphaeroforma arctica JP610]|eukprot:XP_014160094.1 hypothetical protein SARC_01669 [Sphaeroforma arctica JP610]
MVSNVGSFTANSASGHGGNDFQVPPRAIDDGYTYLDPLSPTTLPPSRSTPASLSTSGRHESTEAPIARAQSQTHTHTYSAQSHTHTYNSQSHTHTHSSGAITHSGRQSSRPLPQTPGSSVNSSNARTSADLKHNKSLPSIQYSSANGVSTKNFRGYRAFSPVPLPVRQASMHGTTVPGDDDTYTTFVSPESLSASVGRMNLHGGRATDSGDDQLSYREYFSLARQPIDAQNNTNNQHNSTKATSKPKPKIPSPDMVNSVYTTLDGVEHASVAPPSTSLARLSQVSGASQTSVSSSSNSITTPISRVSAQAMRSPPPVNVRPTLPRATSVPGNNTHTQPASETSSFKPRAAPRPGVTERISPSLSIPEHASINTLPKPTSTSNTSTQVHTEEEATPPARPPKRRDSTSGRINTSRPEYDNVPAIRGAPVRHSVQHNTNSISHESESGYLGGLHTERLHYSTNSISNTSERGYCGGPHTDDSATASGDFRRSSNGYYEIDDEVISDIERHLHNEQQPHDRRISLSSQSVYSQDNVGYDHPQNTGGAGRYSRSSSQSFFSQENVGYDHPQNTGGAGRYSRSSSQSICSPDNVGYDFPQNTGGTGTYSTAEFFGDHSQTPSGVYDLPQSVTDNTMYATPVMPDEFVPRNERSTSSLISDQGSVQSGSARRDMGSRTASAVSLASKGSVEESTFFLPIPVSMNHSARREHLKAVMNGQPRGSWLIRFNCEKGLYVLSVKDIARIRNLWIENRRCHYQLSGRSFKTLYDLVSHFTENQIIDDIGFRLTEPINVPEIIYRRHLQTREINNPRSK